MGWDREGEGNYRKRKLEEEEIKEEELGVDVICERYREV